MRGRGINAQSQLWSRDLADIPVAFRRRRLRWCVRNGTSALLLLCVAAASGCGEAGPRVTPTQAHDLASEFANVLLESPDRRSAVGAARRIAEPVAVEDVAFWLTDYREKLHAISGPRAGCSRSAEPFTVPTGEPCYRFRLVGEIVPDRLNPGYGAIGFGTLTVWIRPRGRPAKVRQFMYLGGFRECSVASNCSSARRALMQRARAWASWP